MIHALFSILYLKEARSASYYIENRVKEVKSRGHPGFYPFIVTSFWDICLMYKVFYATAWFLNLGTTDICAG